MESNKRFALSADGAFVLHFEKGETFRFFLCLKEKSSKKEADQHAVGLPVGMEAIYRKARSLIAKAYPRVHFSLDERNFAARRFFEEL